MNPPKNNMSTQHDALKNEVVKLFQAIQDIKVELATIKHPDSSENHFISVADQLNEIASESENASNTIIQATEAITDILNELKESIRYKGALPVFDTLFDHANTVLEACAFHDITGQRISKVIKIVNLIEGTLNSLVTVVGEEGISALPLSESEKGQDDEGGEGPALHGEGVSQTDIDEIFK